MNKHDWYSDTEPKALKAFLDIQRRRNPTQKVQAVFELNRLLRALAETNERALHPEADDREIFLRGVARRLDRQTMKRVYGWCPDQTI